MNLVPESLFELQSFYRGENPLKILNIGQISKISKINTEDLNLLKLYTNGKGKGTENSNIIKEIRKDDKKELKKI